MKITFRCDPALTDLLPRPMPARAAMPDWLRAMAPRVPSASMGVSLVGRLSRRRNPPFAGMATVPMACYAFG